MRTFIEWFKDRLLEGVESEADLVRALGNWVEPIIKKPHLDDIRTWVSMVRKLSPQIRQGFMLDMISAVDKAIGRLPREDQAEAEKLVASVDDSMSVQNQMVARGYLPTMVQPWKFYTAEQLEDYLARSMDVKHPNLSVVARVARENKELWQELGDEFRAAFTSWYNDEYQKMMSQSYSGSSLAGMVKQQLQGPPDGE